MYCEKLLPYALRVFALLIIFLQASLLPAQDSICNTDEKIRFGGLDWDSNGFHVEVARFILEKGYGCRTDVIPGTSFPLLTALGRGDIDILMEVWMDNVTEAWNKIAAAGKVSTLGVNFPDAVQGIYVPTYMIKGDKERGIQATAPDLKYIKDLNRYWELFRDPEQPSKGRFHNCILGWSCEPVNTKKLYAYGLNEHFLNFRPGSSSTLTAAIVAKYEQGEPFVTYYWGPTWILGKYDLTMLIEPPYNEEIWLKFAKEEYPTEATAYPDTKVYVGVNNEFKERAPRVVAFLRNYETTNQIISEALAYMEADPSRTNRDAAIHFLKTRDDIWGEWVTSDIMENVQTALGRSRAKQLNPWIIKIDKPINAFIEKIVENYQDLFDSIANPIRTMISKVEMFLRILPWWLFFTLCGALAYWASRSISMTLIVLACLAIIGVLGLWVLSMQTLALMLISTFISVLIGIPIGILIAYNNRVRTILLPVLDAMQTMPSFVYLIPALMLFGLGKVPAVFATVIYAVSPLIRLTDHGIRRVDHEVTEAARSFGASRGQLLGIVQLPLALPTIMTGINQTTMLALSMVVIASMIGARGLGEEVLLGIQKLDVGRGFTAGVAIVALAIMLDRITQAFGRKLDKTRN